MNRTIRRERLRRGRNKDTKTEAVGMDSTTERSDTI